MQFQAVYEEKKMSAAEMAARIPDASHIFSDNSHGIPSASIPSSA